MRLGLGLGIPGVRAKGPQLGPELLSNGGFDTDTVWTKGTGWTISAGEAAILVPGATSSLSQAVTINSGARYLMEMSIPTMPAAGILVRAYSGGSPVFNFGAIITSAGVYSRIVTATGAATSFAIDGSAAASATVSVVSLRQVLA